MVAAPSAAARRRDGLPFVLIGAVCVVAGGLLAAAVAASPTEPAVWAAAYLVLVAGVAQIAIGAAQAYLRPRPPSRSVALAEILLWNVGHAAVIAGTVGGVTVVTDLGGALLVVVLALLLVSTRRGRTSWWLRSYQALLALVLISVPVGLVLAELRAA